MGVRSQYYQPMKASVIISGKVRHAKGLCNLRCAIIEQNDGNFTLDIGKRKAKGDLVIFYGRCNTLRQMDRRIL